MINIKFWLFNCSSVTYKWVDVTNTLTGYMHNWKTNFHVYPSHPYLIKLYLVSFSTFCILQTIDDVVNRCIPAVFPRFLLFLSLLILFDFYQFFFPISLNEPWFSASHSVFFILSLSLLIYGSAWYIEYRVDATKDACFFVQWKWGKCFTHIMMILLVTV